MESYQPLQASSSSDNLFELQIDQQNTSYLSEIARWGKFLSIVGFIGIGLSTIFFTVTLLTGNSTSSASFGGTSYDMGYTIGKAIAPILIIAIFLLYFFPTLYLFRFSTQMQTAIRNNDQGYLTNSFGNLKSCFKFLGILTIVILSLYALLLIGGLLFLVATAVR
jgi:hypothetical protein